MHVAVPQDIPHYRIDIRDKHNRKLVTAIEFLSPTNKRGKGRTKYLRKRNRLLESSAHLIEIDLLRKGRRAPMIETYPPNPYFVLVSRADERPSAGVWPVPLNSPLPTIPVPLLAGDGDVRLDLQDAFDKIYDLGSYQEFIDYESPPDVALNPAEAEWADRLLRDAGLRK